jgi:hypothetical protein
LDLSRVKGTPSRSSEPAIYGVRGQGVNLPAAQQAMAKYIIKLSKAGPQGALENPSSIFQFRKPGGALFKFFGRLPFKSLYLAPTL